MTRLRYTTSVSLVPLTLAFCLAGVSDLLLARDHASDIPENARATSYGQGWECEQGYRRVKGECNAVKVPDNAYPTGNAYGRVWKCKWGYRQVAEACVAIKVPANAYLKHTGIEWVCDRGYRADDNACVAIDVPANAYLTGATYGQGGNASVAIARSTRHVSLSSYRKMRISIIPDVTGSVIHLTEGDRTTVHCPR